MITGMEPVGDPVARYLHTFNQIRAQKHWSQGVATFRFVALTLGAAGPTINYDRLELAAARLREGTPWWASPLQSEIRYVVAAMLLRRQLDPADVRRRITETLDAFREHKMPRLGLGPTLAALLLALHSHGRPTPEQDLLRLGLIYRRWRKDHFWLTDANDLPAAANPSEP